MEWPLVSIIIVNFNGAHYLPACLDALARQTYPTDRFEVIVSDNGSTDATLPLLRDQYPWVTLLENGRNLGFASGNNVAFSLARGNYIVLLNNDTAPTPTWLQNLVEVAQADPAAGLVTGHLQLFYPQCEIELQTDVFTPDGDGRLLGVVVAGVDTGVLRGVVQYLDGFYSREVHPFYGNFRWSQGRALLGVPVPLGTEVWPLTLKVAAPRAGNVPVPLKILAQGKVLAEVELSSHEMQTVQVEMPASTRQAARPVEQNTGSLVFSSGAGRDRGTLVRGSEVLYETDIGHYSVVEEVFSGCGASLLLRRATLEQIGVLDDDFFMYYEDTDLCWRAWLGGWKVVYAPQALVPHIHCGTTKEWSPFFTFLTERNRLAMVFKNGTLRQLLRVWSGYFFRVLRLGLETLWMLLFRRPGWRASGGEVRVHLRVIGNLLIWLPALIAKRYWIHKYAKVEAKSLDHWFVNTE
jgi:GT2 family glycosyltransferase